VFQEHLEIALFFQDVHVMKFHPSKDVENSVEIERALPCSVTYLQPGNNIKETKEDLYSGRS
jgi:hypothetical protein